MQVVVVESPAKAKTVGGYLGGGYRVLATLGHVSDLPAKEGSVRPAEGFAMSYETGARARRALGRIAAALEGADGLILATDPDREGEAIAWQVLIWLRERGALGARAVRRVAFREITPEGVREAMARPRALDMDLVRAQQARRALDYLVGFHLSPVLWRKLPGSRSAGRVQSVVGQAGAEEMNQKRLRRVAGHRHGCRHGAVSFMPMMENGGPTPSPGHPTAAPLTAGPPLSVERSRRAETSARDKERSAGASCGRRGPIRWPTRERCAVIGAAGSRVGGRASRGAGEWANGREAQRSVVSRINAAVVRSAPRRRRGGDRAPDAAVPAAGKDRIVRQIPRPPQHPASRRDGAEALAATKAGSKMKLEPRLRRSAMIRSPMVVVVVALGLFPSLLAGCGTTDRDAVRPTAEGVKRETVARVEAATVALASDQHVFRFDGVSSRTFTKCRGTVCGVSATPAGVDAALQRALGDPRADFGSSHFAARLKDSLELQPQAELVNGVTLVEGFGQRSGARPFSAKFFGAWLDDGAFFVNETTLTVRDEMGRPVGLGTVYDASAMGVESAGAPAPVQGMSATWKGMMLGVDVSDAVTRGQFLRGDATLVVEDLANPDVDVAFGNLRDLETGARLEGRTIAPFENVLLDGASFGAKPVGGDDYIQGRFVGDDHAGVVGVFERSEVVGSFGGNRQAGE